MQGMREEEIAGGTRIFAWKRWLSAKVLFLLLAFHLTRFHQDKSGPCSREFFRNKHDHETREETDCSVPRAGFNNEQ